MHPVDWNERGNGGGPFGAVSGQTAQPGIPTIDAASRAWAPFPRGKLGISLRAISSKAPEQAIDLDHTIKPTPLDETLYATLSTL